MCLVAATAVRAGSRAQPVVVPEPTPTPLLIGAVAADAGSIADVLLVPNDFSEFVELARATGWLQQWEGASTFTVFAPTNAAFQDLPLGIQDAARSPVYRSLFVELLRAHVVHDRVTLADADLTTLTTAAGTTLAVRQAEGAPIALGSARVLQADVSASNGIIHAIDTVLRPTDEEAIAIAQRLSSSTETTLALTVRGQVPPLSVPSKAWGFARLQYNSSSRQLAIAGFFGELSSAPRAIGLSPLNVFRAPLGEAGPIARPLELTLSEDESSGTFETQLTLTPLEAAQFRRGELYLALHTIANPAGELRSQLRPPSDRQFVEDGAIEFNPG